MTHRERCSSRTIDPRRGSPRTLFLKLLLLPAWLLAAPAQASTPPVVDDITASSLQVPPGGTVELVVDAHDPDCPDVCDSGCGQAVLASRTAWRLTGGVMLEEDDGVTSSPYVATALWQAPPDVGVYTLTVFIRDNGNFWCGRQKRANRSIDIEVVDSPNAPPEIDSLTAAPLSLFEGESSELACEASDPDGDPVDYSWDTDSGTLTPGPDGTATLVTDRAGLVTVTCTASDPLGGFDADDVRLTVVGAAAERQLRQGLVTPQRLDVDDEEMVLVVDSATGGITALHLASGEPAWRLALPGATAVAVDWNGDLLIGEADGARVVDRLGATVLDLSLESMPGDVVDVAVDRDARRYALLHRTAGRVTVLDDDGAEVLSFGATGDEPDELRAPRGLAAGVDGQWVVADSGHGQVKTYDAAGVLLSTFGELGGSLGEFVQLDDVEVGVDGRIYASDSFQDWIQVFDADGTLRESIGRFGVGLGRFRTAAGMALLPGLDRLAAASVNGSSVQVFVTSSEPAEVQRAPEGSVAPGRLDFPLQAVQTESDPLLVTVSNAGDAPLGLRRIETTGDFETAGGCPPFVAPDESCELQVVFGPKGPHQRLGTLNLWTSEGGEPLEVQLEGTGYVPPGVQLSSGFIDFPDQDVGTTSAPRSVTLTNTGTLDLEILSVVTAGDYATTHDCGAAVAGGDSCRFDVTFTPSLVADHIYGSVTLTTNALDGPHRIELDGRGVNPTLDVADVRLEEGDEPPPEEALFEVRLSHAHVLTVEVDYATVAGTALEGEDYEPVSGTLVFEPGSTRETVAVPVIPDTIMEPDEESFALELSNPRNAVIQDGTGVAVIVDDEACLGPQLIANAAAEERWCEPGLPGWTQVAGAWRPDEPADGAFEGRFAFAAGGAATAELSQEVDVSAYAARIDSGEQRFAFQAWALSLAGPAPDTLRVVVEYHDRTDGRVLGSWDSGETAPVADWLLIEDERAAPAGTGWITVRLLIRDAGGDGLLEAWLDGLALRSVRAPTIAVSDAEGYEGSGVDGSLSFLVTTACPWYRDVQARYRMVDGTAQAGLDHAGAPGTVAIPVGETLAEVSVRLLADGEDEGHESFDLLLEDVSPGEVVALDLLGRGTIVNDDACPRGLGYWKTHPSERPTNCLEVGGELLDEEALTALLSSRGPDASLRLARHLAATKLNLELGTPPVIVPVVEEADAFLAEHPPGEPLDNEERREAQRLKNLLEAYNEGGCDD